MGIPLPAASFVPVATHRVAAPTVVWVNTACFTAQRAIDNAFCMRQPYETAAMFEVEERIQFADRYGGHGIGDMGGSARCATFGDVQVKGVGGTPLLGPKADRFHVSGTVTLTEAAREVIWSEILPVVLPFGVVPALAIVLTKGVFFVPLPNGLELPCQRTLLMRQFALRPAHYMRNTMSRMPIARNTGSDGLSGDARLAKNAISMLDAGLEQAFGTQLGDTTGIERINLGLRLMVQRFGIQLAAGFAKRIFHGALSCSNIALDGRFLDFGVITFVKSYRRRAWAKAWPDQWTQQSALIRTISYLRFHLQKYYSGADASALVSEAELVGEFQAALAIRLEVDMLKMTGVPGTVVEACQPAERQRLLRCLRTIYMRGAGEAFISWHAETETAGENPPPARGGRYDLNAILALASCCEDAALDGALAALLDDVTLRTQFIDAYTGLRQLFMARFETGAHRAALVFVALQANRLNADLEFLARELLDQQLAPYDAEPDDVGAYIAEAISKGRYFLQDEHPDLPGSGAEAHVDALLSMGSQLQAFAMRCMHKAGAGSMALAALRTLLEPDGA